MPYSHFILNTNHHIQKIKKRHVYWTSVWEPLKVLNNRSKSTLLLPPLEFLLIPKCITYNLLFPLIIRKANMAKDSGPFTHDDITILSDAWKHGEELQSLPSPLMMFHSQIRVKILTPKVCVSSANYCCVKTVQSKTICEESIYPI